MKFRPCLFLQFVSLRSGCMYVPVHVLREVRNGPKSLKRRHSRPKRLDCVRVFVRPDDTGARRFGGRSLTAEDLVPLWRLFDIV